MKTILKVTCLDSYYKLPCIIHIRDDAKELKDFLSSAKEMNLEVIFIEQETLVGK